MLDADVSQSCKLLAPQRRNHTCYVVCMAQPPSQPEL
jgi:hypothetical protein